MCSVYLLHWLDCPAMQHRLCHTTNRLATAIAIPD
jgi:hypothetical protein